MPDNATLNARRLAATPRGVATATTVFAARAENSELWDVEGRRYIDFAGGIAVLNTGHRNPVVMKRVEEQLARFTHTAYQVAPYEPYVELAERLNALAPIEGPAKTLFVTTGAEANENAIKIARAHTGRPGVIAFSGGFHGRTNMTMGLTGKVVPYKKKFGPFPGDIYHIPFPMPQHGVTVDDTFAALEHVFRSDIEPERVAALIIEPVQGEGGFYIAPVELMQRLRKLCTEHGIVFIVDEIQTGFARTGKMFAIEHSNVTPDLIVVAKSMAGGFPLSGVIGKAEMMDAPEPGGLGGTYGGNPVACAAALGVLEVIEKDGLLSKSTALGDHVVNRLRQIASRSNSQPIGDIRNLGGMIAFELVKSTGTHQPDAEAAKMLCAKAAESGLILLSCGVFGNTIRILVPLTAATTIVDEGLDIIEKCLADTGASSRQAAG